MGLLEDTQYVFSLGKCKSCQLRYHLKLLLKKEVRDIKYVLEFEAVGRAQNPR